MVPLSTRADKIVTALTFSSQGMKLLEEERFQGRTRYQIVSMDGEKVLKATTQNTASALFREFTVDLEETPKLNWRWRVDHVFDISNQRKKSGDDYPARVYVVIREGFFPWQTKALNYVWSNHPTKMDYWPNPFTSKAAMIPLRSSKDRLGQWQIEQVNIVEDFNKVFGRKINKIDGVAIMSDSDNAGGNATAYYGDIYFSD